MAFLLSGIHVLGQLQRLPEAARFASAVRDPERAQRERLAAIVGECKDTAFGRAHRLGEVRTPRDLQARVPVSTYAEYEPWIARMMRGETNVLTRDKPVFYAASTGTTGTPKRTPTTHAFRKEFQRALSISMAHVAMRFPRAFKGSLLYFVARREVARTEDGTRSATRAASTSPSSPPSCGRSTRGRTSCSRSTPPRPATTSPRGSPRSEPPPHRRVVRRRARARSRARDAPRRSAPARSRARVLPPLCETRRTRSCTSRRKRARTSTCAKRSSSNVHRAWRRRRPDGGYFQLLIIR